MTYRGLAFQTWTTRLVGGLNNKADPRALEMPELARLVDGQFDELGGIQTRLPFALQTGPLDIFGGGTITGSDVRRIEKNGDELLLFTRTKLYSRNVQESKWVYCGEHLATAVDEEPAFQTPE
ncbi:MAG TPA: hypothetical protein VLT45_07775, partial [Kofleriaceae bacterium]|nr:hypothetical protein [Kofleriaceae bacterium]